MEGIKFIVDDKGKKTAVIIGLQKHQKLWEDFEDILIADSRADEPRESLEQVKESLHREGKLVE
ncbi:MAG: hypothetical protein IID18_09190 [Nitrospinae bacterium]|nr:hypothetical protein [Nitrospinota bacterium]